MSSLSRSALVFVGFASALLGCATVAPPTYRLAPSGADVVWAAGRPTLQQQVDGIQVAVGPTGQSGGALGLSVQISNVGAERFEISANDVTFTACTGTVNASCAPTTWVMDPEQELAKLDQRARDERASANVSQGLLAFLLVLNVAADIGSLGRHHHGSVAGTVATAELMDSNAAHHDRAMSNLEIEREFWANTALRRNTVDPGQTAAGIVLMPIYPTARYVWLHLRIGARRFSFRFDQTAVAPA